MKIFKTMALSMSVFGFAGIANAGDGQAYVNIGVDSLEFDTYGVGAKAGYQFSDMFGIEAQGSIGVKDDEQTLGNVTADVGYDYLLGGFAVATIPLGDGLELLGRAGYYYAELSAEGAGVTVTEDADGLAAGIGAQYMWNDVSGIRADYTYLDGDGGHADSVSLAYVRKF